MMMKSQTDGMIFKRVIDSVVYVWQTIKVCIALVVCRLIKLDYNTRTGKADS